MKPNRSLPRRALNGLALYGCSALLAVCAIAQADPAPLPAPVQRVPDAQADQHIADSALEAGDTQLALSLYEKLLKADPQSSHAQLGMADALFQNGDLARAGALYGKVENVAPKDPRAQLGLARVALRERRLDDALAGYQALYKAYPDNPVAAEGLGTVLDLQGHHPEAQQVYRAELERHPEVAGLKSDLGLSLILGGAARAGANVLLDVANLPDAPVQARQNLALAYGVLGNDEAAKRILLTDLPAQSAEDNLSYYHLLRDKLTTTARADDTPPQGVAP